MLKKMYTIGYATKPIDEFIAQLKRFSIDVVADIRSVPYSKVFHEYHRETIATLLKAQGIRYVYLGEELGPRSKDDRHYDEDGQVQFDRLMRSPLFQQGIERLALGVKKGFNIALMCAEKDPATCHRSLLVAYFLEHDSDKMIEETFSVCHINHNGELEKQEDLEKRLVSMHALKQDLFMTEKDAAQHAYNAQLKKTSYIKP